MNTQKTPVVLRTLRVLMGCTRRLRRLVNVSTPGTCCAWFERRYAPFVITKDAIGVFRTTSLALLAPVLTSSSEVLRTSDGLHESSALVNVRVRRDDRPFQSRPMLADQPVTGGTERGGALARVCSLDSRAPTRERSERVGCCRADASAPGLSGCLRNIIRSQQSGLLVCSHCVIPQNRFQLLPAYVRPTD